MAVGAGSPTVRAKRLRAVLRALRSQTGRTATDVAGGLGWATTTLTRLEQSSRKPRAGAIEALLEEYRVTDPEERGTILELAAEARAAGWWDDYKDVLPEIAATYVGLEAEARVLRVIGSLTVPSLLQTPAYARALLRAGQPSLPDEVVDRHLQVAAQRQLRLSGEDEVELWAIISEAALCQVMGDAHTMTAQLEHLVKLASQPNIRIQVLPFTAGVPLVVPFTMMRFSHPLDPDLAHAETCAGGVWVEERSELDELILQFERLVEVCPSVQASAARLSVLVAALRP